MENNDQTPSPRRRLQALLAIPDSQRTEAQWDEIVELEITLAPGNRENGPGRDMRLATSQPVQRKPQHKQQAKPNKPAEGQGAGPGPGAAKSGKPNRNKPRGKPHAKPKAAAPES